MGSFDLLCDNSQKTSLLKVQQGMLWVEWKVLAAATCKKSMAELETQLAEKLPKVHKKHDHITSVLLLVAQVEKASRTQRAKPKLLAKLFSLNFPELARLPRARGRQSDRRLIRVPRSELTLDSS